MRRLDDDVEVHFVPCADSGAAREAAFAGLVRSVDFEVYYVEDTRDDEAAGDA